MKLELTGILNREGGCSSRHMGFVVVSSDLDHVGGQIEAVDDVALAEKMTRQLSGAAADVE